MAAKNLKIHLRMYRKYGTDIILEALKKFISWPLPLPASRESKLDQDPAQDPKSRKGGCIKYFYLRVFCLVLLNLCPVSGPALHQPLQLLVQVSQVAVSWARLALLGILLVLLETQATNIDR